MNNIEKIEHIVYLVKRYENKVDISENIFNEKQLQMSLTSEKISDEQMEEILNEYTQNIENLAKIYIKRIKAILKEDK